MKINQIANIIIVNDQCWALEHILDYLLDLKNIKCKIDKVGSAKVAVINNDPLNYDIVIIDASDDILINNYQSLSEYWKNKNPKLIIVGTSVQRHLLQDKLAKELYDERECSMEKDFDEIITDTLTKYGFVEATPI